MAKPRKMTPEEEAEREKRHREFRELLEKRKALDEKLAAERRHFSIELTESQALVLYRYLYGLEDDQKLDPRAPAFDPAVQRALEVVFFALEDQLPRVDDTATFERAEDELRQEFREYWEPRLPKRRDAS